MHLGSCCMSWGTATSSGSCQKHDRQRPTYKPPGIHRDYLDQSWQRKASGFPGFWMILECRLIFYMGQLGHHSKLEHHESSCLADAHTLGLSKIHEDVLLRPQCVCEETWHISGMVPLRHSPGIGTGDRTRDLPCLWRGEISGDVSTMHMLLPKWVDMGGFQLQTIDPDIDNIHASFWFPYVAMIFHPSWHHPASEIPSTHSIFLMGIKNTSPQSWPSSN